MYRVPKSVEKMDVMERRKYFQELAETAFPSDKKEFTAEELMLSSDYCAYEVFRNFANLREVGYFNFAARIFAKKFVGKWAEIETATGGTSTVYVSSVYPSYAVDLESDEGQFFTELDEILEFWGALFVKSDLMGKYAIPLCYILRAKLLPDRSVDEKENDRQ